jgi:8-oxo-dGTP diphosphatase
MSAARPLGVLAVVRDRRGAVLLQLRDDRDDIVWPGHWSVLGGAVDPGEGVAEALVREVREECGLEVQGGREVCTVVDEDGSGQLLHVFVIEFRGSPDEVTPGEGQRVEFVARERWPRLRMPPYVRALLEALPEGRDV